MTGHIGKRRIAIGAQIQGIPLLPGIQQAEIEHELADRRQVGVAEDHVLDIVDKHFSLLGEAQVCLPERISPGGMGQMEPRHFFQQHARPG